MNPNRYPLALAFVLLIATCLVLTARPAAAQTLADELDAILTDAEWYGTALVAADGEVVLQEGYGLADIASATPNTPETRFLIGSITKQFTATLVLLLMEEGLLDLHVSIDTYLPDYPQPQGNQITLHHLLTHTSGIPGDNFDLDWEAAYTPAELIAHFWDLPLQFEPGSDVAYSNIGYLVVGYIIEVVTGQTYADAIEERAFTPFGLHDTGYPDPDYDGIATGYVPFSTTPAPYFHPSLAYSAGALYSTVGDLYRWDQLLYGDSIFADPATKELLFTEHVSIGGPPGYYGYGWLIGHFGPSELPELPEPFYVIGHGGRVPGFISNFDRMVEDGHTVILLRNNDDISSQQSVWENIIVALYTFPAGSEDPGGSAPSDLALVAPFPNPASGRVSLPFALTESGEVHLGVYDVLGREVAVLAEGTRPAGPHEATLDASRLAPGLYLVRLTARAETATRRLTVVR